MKSHRPPGAVRVLLVAGVLLAACSSQGGPIPEPSGPLWARSPVRGAFEFAVIGDFGSGEDEEYAVARALRAWAEARPLEALVTTGDNIYESGHPEDFADAWHEPFGWVDRAGIPVIASVGNHDVRTDAGAPVMELFSMPARWYAHRFGHVELFVLDGNRPTDDDQLSWLAGALRRSTAPWRVAVVHQPPYTCGNHEGSEEIRERWVPILRAGGVDLVLSGHDHNYQRFPPIGDLVFVISGGGGQDLHEIEGCPEGTPAPVSELDDRHHFLVVRASEERLRLRAVAVPGGVVDDVTLRG